MPHDFVNIVLLEVYKLQCRRVYKAFYKAPVVSALTDHSLSALAIFPITGTTSCSLIHWDHTIFSVIAAVDLQVAKIVV